MPFGFFIRLRCFVRVERVILKCFEVRYFHEFDQDLLWKETRVLEDDYSLWRSSNPKVDMIDMDGIVSTMTIRSLDTYTSKI